MSVLMIQIIQTRILSVVSLYYMAFFSISMAMLGLTAGALIEPPRVCRRLLGLSHAASLCSSSMA
jgi:hypothetical protein